MGVFFTKKRCFSGLITQAISHSHFPNFSFKPTKKEPFLTLGKNRGKYRSNGDFPYKILIYVVGWEISYKGAGGEIRGRNS